tara:strand:+ start:59 stop:2458 length:2400 start_codon:yes stop_codon:yes gene_type:complete
MRNLIPLFSFILAPFFAISQSLTAPVAEGVYGGRVHAIDAYALGADSTRIVISTESANSLFYADVKSTQVGSKSYLADFLPVPGADMDDGFGDNINKIAVHENSQYIFFLDAGHVYRVAPKSGSSVGLTLISNISQIKIVDDNFYAVEGGDLHFGSISSSGVISLNPSSPITISSSGLSSPPIIEIDKVSQEMWIFVEGSNPELYKSSEPYTAFGSSTSFSSISLSSMIKANVEYRAFGSAPDGFLYIMGNHYPSGSNVSDIFYVVVSEDSAGTWYHYDKPFSGPFAQVAGPNIGFAGTANKYYMSNGDSWNSNNGDSTAWNYFGVPGGLNNNNRANSGAVQVDPVNDSLVYFTTNVAFGFSADYGSSGNGFNSGLTAVQVYDMEMTSDYETGWVASKSGIRKVSNYKSAASWSATQFPNGDGSPYFSIAMAGDHTDTVYAGNVRIKKTTDGGANWNLVFDPTAPSGGNIYPPHGTECRSLEINPWNPDVVLAGFASDLSSYGGLFLTTDGGNNWSQLLVESASPGSDVDVHDIIFTDSTTAYIGVFYDLASPQGKSIYKVSDIGSLNNVSQNMDASNTVVGYQIVASIYDLEISPSGDTLFAAGTDAGINHPICYYKDLAGTDKWEVISTSGFPSGSNDVASAVTIGANVVFCAVNSDIYTYDLSVGGSWSLGYSYPVGTQINFLFYDELLVGTGTGLYAQYLNPNFSIAEKSLNNIAKIAHVYPNPSHDYIQIELLNSNEEIGKLSIYGLDGKSYTIVKSRDEGFRVLLNLKHLKSGIYILDLEQGKDHFTERIIVN